MRVGVVLWSRTDRFGKVVLGTLEELGCETLPIFPAMECDIWRYQRQGLIDVLAVTLTMGAALQRLLAAAESARAGRAEVTR